MHSEEHYILIHLNHIGTFIIIETYLYYFFKIHPKITRVAEFIKTSQ